MHLVPPPRPAPPITTPKVGKEVTQSDAAQLSETQCMTFSPYDLRASCLVRCKGNETKRIVKRK